MLIKVKGKPRCIYSLFTLLYYPVMSEREKAEEAPPSCSSVNSEPAFRFEKPRIGAPGTGSWDFTDFGPSDRRNMSSEERVWEDAVYYLLRPEKFGAGEFSPFKFDQEPYPPDESGDDEDDDHDREYEAVPSRINRYMEKLHTRPEQSVALGREFFGVLLRVDQFLAQLKRTEIWKRMRAKVVARDPTGDAQEVPPSHIWAEGMEQEFPDLFRKLLELNGARLRAEWFHHKRLRDPIGSDWGDDDDDDEGDDDMDDVSEPSEHDEVEEASPIRLLHRVLLSFVQYFR